MIFPADYKILNTDFFKIFFVSDRLEAIAGSLNKGRALVDCEVHHLPALKCLLAEPGEILLSFKDGECSDYRYIKPLEYSLN